MKKDKVIKSVHRSNKRYALPCLAIICLVTFISFSNCLKNDWLNNWDDNIYVLGSESVQDPLATGIKKMFTSYETDNYHPLTTLSYSIGHKLYGFDAQKFHRDNLILHLLNVALVFWLIQLLVGRIEVSTIVTVFFAIHPMRVESVVWISERKDVLYSFFYLVSIISYNFYVKKNEKKYLACSFFLFLCSLLSKSAAVSLPMILFLVDYHYGKKIMKETIAEKIPFLLLSIILGLIAISSQSSANAIWVAPDFPIFDRIFLVSYSVLFYIVKMVAPINLSALYLYPQKIDGFFPWIYYVCPIIILLIAIAIYRTKFFRRELIFGALFYLFSISPVLQIIPVGRAITADRYSYIPYIGLFYIVAMFYSNFKTLFSQWSTRKPLLTVLLILAVGIFSVLTWKRNKIWKNSLSLISDAIEKNSGAYLYQDYLYASRGVAKEAYQDYRGAVADYNEALNIRPAYVDVLYNRGADKYLLKDSIGAMADYNEIIKLNPAYVKAYYSRGVLKIHQKDYDGAIADLDETLRLNPSYGDAYNSRGAAKYFANRKEDACADWMKAVQLGGEGSRSNIAKYCK